MSKKTETEFRAALTELGLKDEEVESQVVSALAKGTIVADQGEFSFERDSLDQAADQWASELAKASHDDDEDEDDEPAYSDEGDEDEDGSEEMSKALGAAVNAAVETAVAPLRKELGLVKARIEAAGNLTKALAQKVSAQLAKGSSTDFAPVLARLNEIEALIKGPRGDFRGVNPNDFVPVGHPGDSKSELNKGTIDRRRLADFLFQKQKAARGNAEQANALHKAIYKAEDVTTSASELAQIAQDHGFTA